MKKNVLKYYIAALYFCSTLIMVAQPGETSDGDALEGADAPAAPIDDYVLLIALIGILFVFLKLYAYLRNTLEE